MFLNLSKRRNGTLGTRIQLALTNQGRLFLPQKFMFKRFIEYMYIALRSI